MGEDAQIDDPDEGYGLSPVLDETEISTEVGEYVDPGVLVYSVDGSYAPRFRDKDGLREVTSRESVVYRSGVFCDESGPILANISRTSQFVVRQNGSTICIPQPLDVPLKPKKSQVNRSRNSVRPSSVKCREISPIPAASPEKNPSRSAEVYDPLRKISQGASDTSLDSNMVRQQANVLNALKDIMTNRENQKRLLSRPSSTTALYTAITRSGSSSTVSTGRDRLTSQVKHLEDEMAKINFYNRAIAGCDRRTGSNRTDSAQDSFAMTDEPIVIRKAASLSSSSSASTLEQARHSTPHVLADAAIRDADECTKALRSGALNYMISRSVGTNTQRGESVCVKHHIITHRIEKLPDHYKHHRRHSASLLPSMRKPEFRPFKLDSQPLFFDFEDIHHFREMADVHGGRNAAFDGIISGTTGHDVRREVQHQRKIGGGKRGRPVVIGRAVYIRGRKLSRPASAHVLRSSAEQMRRSLSPMSSKEPTEKKGQINIVNNEEAAPKPTEEHAVQTEAEPLMVDVGIIAKDEIEEEEEEKIEEGTEATRCSSSGSPKHVRFRKKSDAEKPPFMGSGQKSDSTFSIAGNKQQVMKIVSTHFSDWQPLVTKIIFDSDCRDYAQALQKALARKKQSHFHTLESMKDDLKHCRSESVKNELRAEIEFFREGWTRRHENVLNRLNNQIARGGVWSQVQQLKAIYSAFKS